MLVSYLGSFFVNVLIDRTGALQNQIHQEFSGAMPFMFLLMIVNNFFL